MKRKEYISPALKVRRIKLNHFIAASLGNDTNPAQTDYDPSTGNDGIGSGDGNNDAKSSNGFNWSNPGE